jgi:hypothetical protein
MVSAMVVLFGAAWVPNTAAATTANSPNPTLTPGGFDVRVTQANVLQTICKLRYRANMKTAPEVKAKVYLSYGIAGALAQSRYVLDHLVPLELGGSNEVANLWPQLKSASLQKDKVEDDLRAAVCSRTTELR